MRDVASLEWVYLELLDGRPTRPETLLTWLHEKPKFFVDLLKVICLRSDQPARKQKEQTAAERARATQAYRLLNSWRRVPGASEEGVVDEEALLGWIDAARRLAKKEGRLEMCDLKIGGVLAHAPPESDGSWPCVPVRNAFEHVGTDALAEAFEVAIMNKRGAYWKSLDEGGLQERELAKQIYNWTEACSVAWPAVAASLRRVGDRYEASARREDLEAQSR